MIEGVVLDSRYLGNFNDFNVTAYIIADPETEPEDVPGVYSAEFIDAFYNGEWFFVSLAVVASREDIQLGFAYLSDVEHGSFPIPDESDNIEMIFLNGLDRAEDDDYRLIAEAVNDARKCLASLIR